MKKAIAAIAYGFIAAFVAMLTLGIAHGFDVRVPAFGYWTTYFVTVALAWITTSFADLEAQTRDNA